MSIGNSGRVVVEVDPDLKKELYASLTREGLTLKDWFIESAQTYLLNKTQMSLGFDGRQKKEVANEAA